MVWTTEKQAAYNKEYYQKNKDKIKQAVRANANKNKPKIKQRNGTYYQNNKFQIKQTQRTYYLANKFWIDAKKRDERRAIRSRAIAILGGRCVCLLSRGCGGSDERLLQFDHKEPAAGNRGHNVAALYIIKHHNPTEVFQLLCANCHVIKTEMDRALGWQGLDQPEQTEPPQREFDL
jgi:5-methylcytosine-specific restriction endonuclease McrA